MKSSDQKGYLYVAEVGDYIKIGFTTNPTYRRHTLLKDYAKRPRGYSSWDGGVDFYSLKIKSFRFVAAIREQEQQIHKILNSRADRNAREWYPKDDPTVRECVDSIPLSEFKLGGKKIREVCPCGLKINTRGWWLHTCPTA